MRLIKQGTMYDDGLKELQFRLGGEVRLSTEGCACIVCVMDEHRLLPLGITLVFLRVSMTCVNSDAACPQ